MHPLAQQVQVLRLDRDLADDLPMRDAQHPAGPVGHLVHQRRPEQAATVAEGGCVHGLDQRRGQHVGLADAHGHGVADVPAAVGRAGRVGADLELEVGRGRHAGARAGHLDAGLGSVSEGPRIGRQGVGPEQVGDLVEEGVAGGRDRLLDVHRPVVVMSPVPVGPGAEGEVGRAAQLGVGGDLALLEARAAGDHLEGRAGRVLARQRAVVKGLAGVREQLLVVALRDAPREEVVVVTGDADHGQDLARPRIGHNARAGLGVRLLEPVGERVMDGLLEP